MVGARFHGFHGQKCSSQGAVRRGTVVDGNRLALPCWRAFECFAHLSRGSTHCCVERVQGIVKQFFNEKEVTSTLVMDALYSGCKQIEEHSRSWLEVSAG